MWALRNAGQEGITAADRSWSLALGIPIGVSVFFLSCLPLKWIAVGVGLFVLVTLAAILKEPERLFLFLLGMAFPIQITNWIGNPPPEHMGGAAAGFYQSVIDAPLAILYLLWLRDWVRGRGCARIRFGIPESLFALFYFACTLSLTQAEYVDLGLFELLRRAKFFAIYFYIANRVRTKHHARMLVGGLMASVALQATLGIGQFVTKSTLGLERFGARETLMKQEVQGVNFVRIRGTLGHPNPYAMMIAMSLPIAVALLLGTGRSVSERWMLTFALGLGGMALIQTLSRGGWINAAVGTLAVVGAILVGRRRLLSARMLKWLFLCVGIAAVLSVVFGHVIMLRLTEPLGSPTQDRLNQYKMAWTMIKCHPVLGVGLNNFTEVMGRYDPTGISVHFPTPVHNVYLLIAAETGFVGLATFLAFYVSILWNAWVAFRRLESSWLSLAALGLGAGLCGLIFHNAVAYPFVNDTVFGLFFTHAGFIVGLRRNFPEQRRMEA